MTSYSELNNKVPYALAVLIGAFLLFLVQPLLAKAILPWFGGSLGVWTTSMLFFQITLLAGYLYAHLLNQLLSSRNQMVVHITLLLLAVLLLPIIPSPDLKPNNAESPILNILLLLTSTVGLQYFMVATTAPLAQAWFSRKIPELMPVVWKAADYYGFEMGYLNIPTKPRNAILWSEWNLLTKNKAIFNKPLIKPVVIKNKRILNEI